MCCVVVFFLSHNLSQQKQLKNNDADRSKAMFFKYAAHSQSFRQLKHQCAQHLLKFLKISEQQNSYLVRKSRVKVHLLRILFSYCCGRPTLAPSH